MADNATKKKGRATGSGKRYIFPLLLILIKKVMPVCSSEWAAVAEIYQKDSKEAKRRDGGELKRTFYNNKKMCNKHKAPTGTSDDATFVKECISLAKDLGDKDKGLAGGSDSEDGDEDEDDNDDDNEEDDEVEAEDAGANADEQEAIPLEGNTGESGKKRKISGVQAATTPRTKNSKVTGSTGSSEGSRQGTSSIIKSIGESVSSMAHQSMIEMMIAQQQSQAQQQTQMFMQMMQQQQQAAQTAQQQQQQQQTMMQIMMMMMGGGRANRERSSSSSRAPLSSFPNFNLDEEDDRPGI
jgi:hypothetical protein